jgi:hypothetical protein
MLAFSTYEFNANSLIKLGKQFNANPHIKLGKQFNANPYIKLDKQRLFNMTKYLNIR